MVGGSVVWRGQRRGGAGVRKTNSVVGGPSRKRKRKEKPFFCCLLATARKGQDIKNAGIQYAVVLQRQACFVCALCTTRYSRSGIREKAYGIRYFSALYPANKRFERRFFLLFEPQSSFLLLPPPSPRFVVRISPPSNPTN